MPLRASAVLPLALRCALPVGLLAPAAAAQQLTTELVASGFNRPIFVTHAPDDASRLFVVEQPGYIRIIDAASGAVLPDAFLDIDAIVSGGTGGETGLLGLAFSPDYADSGRFFVVYTNNTGGLATVLAEYRVDPENPDRADASSGRPLLRIPQPFANHNGGWLGFGPDGYLYMSSGDGGDGNDPHNNGQNPHTLLGAMLRLDVSDPEQDYEIPPDNPFTDGAEGAPEVWAYGLRNPWRPSFDRATGDLWIADVGQGAREEINFQPASSPGGENYGWRCREGFIATPGITGCENAGPFVDPVHDYTRSLGCSVTGGYVYRGCALGAAYRGLYFFGDYCSGRIWTLDPASPATRTQRLSGANSLTSFGEDAAGELYYTVLNGSSQTGEVRRIVREDGGPACPCPADRNGDHAATVDDLLAYLGAFRGADADMDGDGDTDVNDLLAYLGAFRAGCP